LGVEEAVEEIGIELPDGDYQTIAGFVLTALGHIPTQGERFERGTFKMEVTRMSGLKIETIKVEKLRGSDPGVGNRC
jgi:putative hemolysin